MAIPKRYVRDSSSIPTMSGRSSQGDEPHTIYMRITCLEMEKARRSKERKSAMARVNHIDERIQSIDIEKADLLGKMGDHVASRGAVRATPLSPDNGARPPFRIRY
jgi:hypothetical protein